MKASEISARRKRIMEILQEQKTLRAIDAVRILDVSHETVRQDFNYLAEQGLLKKVHGSVQLTESVPIDDIVSRKPVHHAEKLAIVREALKLIPAGSCTIGLDSGSTVALLASYIADLPPKTIFTNSWYSMAALLESKHDCYFSGGHLEQNDMSFHGNIALNSFQGIGIDLCFMGSSGVWNHEGICTGNYLELDVKRQYIWKSAKKIVLMDSSKFATSSFVEVAKWNTLDILITDSRIAEEAKERLSRDLKVIIAEPLPEE